MPRVPIDSLEGRISYCSRSIGKEDHLILIRWLTPVEKMICRSDSIGGTLEELNSGWLHEVRGKSMVCIKRYHTWKRCLYQILA